jgi:hypothetical protein
MAVGCETEPPTGACPFAFFRLTFCTVSRQYCGNATSPLLDENARQSKIP